MKEQSQFGFQVADISFLVGSSDPGLELRARGAIKDFSAVAKPDARVSVSWKDLSKFSLGTPVFDSGDLWRLYRPQEEYLYSFTSPLYGSVPYEVASFGSDFATGKVYLHRQYFEGQTPYPLDYPLDELWMVNLLSQGRGVEVHGCGVIDTQDEGYLFVGHSGTGKSSMARLWQEHRMVQILSDDRIILRKMDGRLWMYGTPWHGEAGFRSSARAPLTRIYFLKHGEKDELLPTSAAETVGRLFSTSFLPFHSREALDFTLGFFEEVVEAVPCSELRFRPDERVVEFIRSTDRQSVAGLEHS